MKFSFRGALITLLIAGAFLFPRDEPRQAFAQFSDQSTWGGTSGGSANAQTVSIGNLVALRPGVQLRFLAGFTTTGAATLNVSSTGATAIKRQTSSGPLPLAGGEIVSGQLTTVVYDGTAFQLLNAPVTASLPVGNIRYTSNPAVGSRELLGFGQALARASYPDYLASATIVQSAVRTSTSPTITGLTDTSQLGPGMPAEGTGFAAGTTIVSCASTACTLSNNASSSGTSNVTFFLYGYGSGGDATTVGLFNCAGVVVAGRTNMSGTDNGLLPTFAALNRFVGSSTNALSSTNQLPQFTPAGTNSAITPTITDNRTWGFSYLERTIPTGAGATLNATDVEQSSSVKSVVQQTGTITSSAVQPVFTGVAIGSASPSSFATVQPTRSANCAVTVLP